MSQQHRLALFVGGPSEERGISLNSGRSIVDHLTSSDLTIDPIIYYDRLLRAFSIDRDLLYCNTPDDFDFKLAGSASLSEAELGELLTGVDLAFPAIHGPFGEDGELQALLERLGVPYVGSGPAASEKAYDKALAHDRMVAAGIPSIPSLIWPRGATLDLGPVRDWISRYGAVVAKPVRGGSSLGIVVHRDPEMLAADLLAADQAAGHIIQPYVRGTEFTVMVLEGPNGPVPLLPVEIEIVKRSGLEIFSYRHKYLSTNESTYHCPPRFDLETVALIRETAVRVFGEFDLRDFARIDGWVTDDGAMLISDINPISGMEQNSFMFLQAAEVGLSHAAALRYVLTNACARAQLAPPAAGPVRHGAENRIPVPVIFGGSTAERQVSLLSGSNVWMKLSQSERYEPTPYLLRDDASLWRLPYASALRHTVEEVEAYCRRTLEPSTGSDDLRRTVQTALGLETAALLTGTRAELVNLDDLLDRSSVVFLGLHGGDGENGTIQRACEERGVAFNGPGSVASALCMDKYRTAMAIRPLATEGIYATTRIMLDDDTVAYPLDDDRLLATWTHMASCLGAPPYVIKPIGDGCSAGVVPLRQPSDLGAYLRAVQARDTTVSGRDFSMLRDDYIVDMPASAAPSLMVEQYVQTDSVTVRLRPTGEGSGLVVGARSRTGWIEVTVGVLGNRGAVRALSPSLTVASDQILSLDEKFMGGTGVNLTPPPVPPLGHVRPEAITAARRRIERIAEVLGLDGYARVDAFMQVDSGELVLIEVNTLPGLTPSTVIFHQALAEPAPMIPRVFLETILDLARQRQAGEGASAGYRASPHSS